MRTVLFIFAGRRANLEVLMPYLDRILDDRPEAELHLWDLTRNPVDQSYVRRLEGAHEGRVRVLTHLHTGFKCLYPSGAVRRRGWPVCTCINHKPPYEQPYRYYAERSEYNDTVFVKMDDDVLFLETESFDDLVAPLTEYPNRVVSASVVNNAVCAKYQRFASETANKFAVGDPEDPDNDRRWWALHTDPDFARWTHWMFLDSPQSVHESAPKYIRTRPGEAISINCIAFTHQTMKRLACWFANDERLGDEGAVDRMLPWICTSFRAAHLTFGPQDKAMQLLELASIRDRYTILAKEYLT